MHLTFRLTNVVGGSRFESPTVPVSLIFPAKTALRNQEARKIPMGHIIVLLTLEVKSNA